MSGRAGRRGKDEKGLVILMVDQQMGQDVAKRIIKGKEKVLVFQSVSNCLLLTHCVFAVFLRGLYLLHVPNMGIWNIASFSFCVQKIS